jgi:hypothetical protein
MVYYLSIARNISNFLHCLSLKQKHKLEVRNVTPNYKALGFAEDAFQSISIIQNRKHELKKNYFIRSHAMYDYGSFPS